jgi:hypothetical protein
MMSSPVKFKLSPTNLPLLIRFLFGAHVLAAGYVYVVSLERYSVTWDLLVPDRISCVTRDVCKVFGQSYMCESVAAFGAPVVPVLISLLSQEECACAERSMIYQR